MMRVDEFDVFIAPPVIPIADVRHRDRVAIGGVVGKLAEGCWAGGVRSLDVTVADPTGAFTVSFLGRRRIAGIEIGRRLVLGGAVLRRRGRLTMMNPYLWLQATEDTSDTPARAALEAALV